MYQRTSYDPLLDSPPLLQRRHFDDALAVSGSGGRRGGLLTGPRRRLGRALLGLAGLVSPDLRPAAQRQLVNQR